jgi:hypothetical protein
MDPTPCFPAQLLGSLLYEHPTLRCDVTQWHCTFSIVSHVLDGFLAQVLPIGPRGANVLAVSGAVDRRDPSGRPERTVQRPRDVRGCRLAFCAMCHFCIKCD